MSKMLNVTYSTFTEKKYKAVIVKNLKMLMS